MSAYVAEATKELKKGFIPVSPRMRKVAALLEAIEEMKRKIAETQFNDRMPYVIKTTKLAEMREALLQTEHYTLSLLRAELDEHGSVEGCDGHCNDDDGEDGHDAND